MAAINLFEEPTVTPQPTLSKEDKLARNQVIVTDTTKGCARNLLWAYQGIRQIVYNSPDYTAEEFYAALGEPASTQLATVIVKSVINRIAPNTIVDEVPTLSIGE
jgi:hypothetical protein